MRLITTSGIALALLATGSIHQAQLSPSTPKVLDATYALEPDLPLRAGVIGLTRENAPALKAALAELSVQAYVCDPCKVEMVRAGQCPKCTAALQLVKRALLPSVAPAPDESVLALSLSQRHVTRLSEIEAAMKRSAVTFDATKLPLPGRMTLVVRGGTADKVALVERALAEARIFEEVKVAYNAATSEMLIAVRSGATAPMRARVVTALEAQQLQLVDVHFARVREAS